MSAGGLVVRKKEMTKLWVDGAYMSATMLELVPQELVRYKSEEKDGYVAAVVGVEKKELKEKEKGIKTKYTKVIEFSVDDNFAGTYNQWDVLDEKPLEGVEEVSLVGTSKGKGFQGVMKRFHASGGPKTHGSKFHRQIGSLGNRKPRRVQKGHPHAGRMGGDRITLKGIKILDKMIDGTEKIIIVKGSVPGAYNDLVKIVID